MSACREFRRRLERALAGAPAAPDTTALGWHEHLLSCGPCRALLEEEQALETLLASLPEPELPADLARRVLARLRAARDRSLDELLALDEPEAAPPGLDRRLLAGLADARAAGGGEREDAALDALLGRVPDPVPPADLAGRVLAALAPARRRPALRLLRGGGLRALAAAAALALVAWALWPRGAAPPEEPLPLVDAGDRGGVPGATGSLAAADAPAPELLASLELLEDWELLMSEDLDLLLASLDVTDEMLLDLDRSAELRPGEEGRDG